jgi:hypothetical protein
MPNDKTKNGIDEKKLELEYEQWECQKEWHRQENEIENKKLKQARLDTWIRGLVSGILGTAIAVSIPAAITIYGKTAEEAKTKRAEEQEKEKTKRAEAQRKQETLIQLINSRESSDSNLRAQMFTALLQHYFQQRDYRTQIAILEIIGLNFRDSLHTKPMFERLHIEIDEKEEKPQELLEALRKASGRIIKDQLQQIRQSKEGDVCEIEYQKSTMKKESKRPDCFQELAISLIDIKDDHIIVQTNSKDGVLLESKGNTSGENFKVSFYDMPMIDYTSVKVEGGNWKYTIVLKEIDKENNTVIIAIATLPEDTFGTSEEYRFDELLKNYLIE